METNGGRIVGFAEVAVVAVDDVHAQVSAVGMTWHGMHRQANQKKR